MNLIKNVTIDWMEGFSNRPRFLVTFKGTPKHGWWPSRDTAIWKNYSGIHFAQVGGGVVAYFYSDGKPCGGYGGAKFTGTFDNGERFEYIGAWSSRAAVVNRMLKNAGLPDSVVDVYDPDNNRSTAVLASYLIEWVLQNNPDFGLAWIDSGDAALTLEPTYGWDQIKQSSGYRKYVMAVSRN